MEIRGIEGCGNKLKKKKKKDFIFKTIIQIKAKQKGRVIGGIDMWDHQEGRVKIVN